MSIGAAIGAFCMNIPLGYGLAELIMAHMLESSNVLGNSRSSTDKISTKISYTAKTDNIAMDEWGFSYFCKGNLRKMKNAPEHMEIMTRSIPKDSLKPVESDFQDEVPGRDN